MKRAGPEERDELPPLFAHAEREAASNRAEVGMTRAASKAERVRPGWHADALAAVRAHASANAVFLAEEVPYSLPLEADPRAFGSIMREAARLGFVIAAGYALANTSNRAPKTLWRSLIVQVPAGTPASP